MKIVNFWKPHEKNGFLSQWYRTPFKEDDIQFFNAEQYMMYQNHMIEFGVLEQVPLIQMIGMDKIY